MLKRRQILGFLLKSFVVDLISGSSRVIGGKSDAISDDSLCFRFKNKSYHIRLVVVKAEGLE